MMPTTLDRVFHPENLQRAWRCIQSNPLPTYKNFFRGLYGNYAIAENELLADLLDRLKRGIYEPAHACKVFFPKATGSLRGYSLLTVEDQIVYQAFANEVAARFQPVVAPYYFSRVFSHMLAAPSSAFFFRKWLDGYRAMNARVRKAFADGLRHSARFDLATCYDSIDHNVLVHFLGDLGLDSGFCGQLCAYLRHWSATSTDNKRIYHGHGVPQGPLSSHLLAEVVLHHFDRNQRARSGVRYFRYVDDIRLLAATEQDLRRALYELDLLCKDIGLFPQSAKILIHRIQDIEDELKTISRPQDDESWYDVEDDQRRLHKMISDLCRRGRVADGTRFKYLLAKAMPNAATNAKVWKVLASHPDLYENVLAYFQRYKRLPRKDADRLTSQIGGEELHGVIIREMLRTATGRLPDECCAKVDVKVAKLWKKRTSLPGELAAEIGIWGMKRDLFKPSELAGAIAKHREWYTRAILVSHLDNRAVPQPDYNKLLFEAMNDSTSDVAIAAASQLGYQGTAVDQNEPMHTIAGPVLAAFGVLSGAPKRACGIHRALRKLLGEKAPAVDWKKLFGRQYKWAERQAVRTASYSGDATAWVQGMDVFCDRLLNAMFEAHPELGGYQLGSIGSAVFNSGTRFEKKYPYVFRFAQAIHGKRGESDLSHPAKKRAGKLIKPTSFIPYGYIRQAKKMLQPALREVSAEWPPPVAQRQGKAV
jgi:hypothetical protein